MQYTKKFFVKALVLILGALVLFMAILKLDGICMREWEFSIVPFAIIGMILVIVCIVFAFRTRSQGVKLTLAYLSVLPFCLAIGEVFFWYKITYKPDGHVQPDAIIGTANAPFGKDHRRRVVDGQLIYDVVYENDEHGLRITPNANTESKTCLNIYGGSFVYGDALNAQDTLSAYLASALPEVQVRNFGISGGGAHQMLARLEFDMDSGVLENCDENLFIYVAIPHHLYRALGVFGGPKYTLDEKGVPVYRGKFNAADWRIFDDETSRHFTIFQRFANQLEKSYIKQFLEYGEQYSTEKMLRRFPHGYASNTYFSNIDESSFDTYFAIIKQIQHIVREKYGAKLHIIFWDYDMHAQFLDKYDTLIESALTREHIPYTKVSEILGESYKQDLGRVKLGDYEHFKYRISRWDTHPNALANQQIAAYITKEIIQDNLTFAKSPHKEQQ